MGRPPRKSRRTSKRRNSTEQDGSVGDLTTIIRTYTNGPAGLSATGKPGISSLVHLRQICQTVHCQLLRIALAGRSQAFDVARNSKSRIQKPGGIKRSRRGVGTQYPINNVFHGELQNKCTAIAALQHSGAAWSIPFLACRCCRESSWPSWVTQSRSEPAMRLPNHARRKRKSRWKIRFPLSLRR